MTISNKILFILAVLFLGLIFIGCASVSSTKGYADTLEEAHSERLGNTIIGMDINEFKTVWPEATKSSVSAEGDIYEFIYNQLGPLGQPNGIRIIAHFHFTDNKLVKYESNQRFL